MANAPAVLIGYARVSTEDQELRLQTEALKEAGVAVRRIYSDKLSGAGVKRPGLLAAMKALREGDTLVAWKLDRLARSLWELKGIADKIEAKGAHLRILTMAVDTKTPTGKLMFAMVGAFAEFERDMIRERTMAGLAAAKRAGRVGGRARTITPEKEAAMIADLQAGMPVAELSRKHGISRTHIYARIRGEWATRLSGAEQ